MDKIKKLELELNEKIDITLSDLKKEGVRPSRTFVETLRAYASYFAKNGVAPYKNETYSFNGKEYEIGKWISEQKYKDFTKTLEPDRAKLLLAVDSRALETQRAFFTANMVHRVHNHTQNKIDPATQSVLVNYEVYANDALHSNVLFGVDENGMSRDRLSNGQYRERFANFPESAIELNLNYDKGDGSGKKNVLYVSIAKCIIFDKIGPDSKGNYKLDRNHFVWRNPGGTTNGKTFQINIKEKNVPACLKHLYNKEKGILVIPVGERVPDGITLTDKTRNQCRVNLDSSKATIHFGYEKGKGTPLSISIGAYRQAEGDNYKETANNRFTVDEFMKLFPDKRNLEITQDKGKEADKKPKKTMGSYVKNAKSSPQKDTFGQRTARTKSQRTQEAR